MAQINKPTDYFNTKLYTGNGSTQSITGVGFQPDFVWCKTRSIDKNHNLFDVVRGVQKRLITNATNAEDTISGVTSFDSDGFSIGSNTNMNTSGATHVAWNWLASNTTASNTDGSVTASLSANATAGFSISTFTTPASGTFTVGHGLGVAPKFIIYRPVTSSGWQIGHDSIGWTKAVFFDTQSEQTSTAFGNTAPTTSVWTGNVANVGANASSFAYCFAEKKGFSKFGSYTGNGSADGTFVYTGFKPAFVLIKITSTTNDWEIHDNKRGSSNVINAILQPNVSEAESTSGREMDFLSNGFKLRNNGSQNNLSGGTFIYMAIAENPLVGTNNIPATAR